MLAPGSRDPTQTPAPPRLGKHADHRRGNVIFVEKCLRHPLPVRWRHVELSGDQSGALIPDVQRLVFAHFSIVNIRQLAANKAGDICGQQVDVRAGHIRKAVIAGHQFDHPRGEVLQKLSVEMAVEHGPGDFVVQACAGIAIGDPPQAR